MDCSGKNMDVLSLVPKRPSGRRHQCLAISALLTQTLFSFCRTADYITTGERDREREIDIYRERERERERERGVRVCMRDVFVIYDKGWPPDYGPT